MLRRVDGDGGVDIGRLRAWMHRRRRGHVRWHVMSEEAPESVFVRMEILVKVSYASEVQTFI